MKYRFSSFLIAALFAVVLVQRALAISAVPYTEILSYNLRVQGDGQLAMAIYDELGGPGYPSTTWVTSGGTNESVILPAVMRPGKVYNMAVTGSGANYTGWLSFVSPTGYRLYVNGSATDRVPLGTRTTSINLTFTVELRPIAIAEEAMPYGTFSGIQVGKAISWDIGLGSLYGDRSAGRITFKEYDLSNSPTNRARLFLSIVNSTAEVWSINDGPSNSVLRQVNTPLGVVDIVDDGTGYWIKFYSSSVSEGTGPGGSGLRIFHGAPWKTFRIETPAAGQFKITETEGSLSRVSLLTLTGGSVPSGNYVWTLQEGDGTTWVRTKVLTSTATLGTPATGGTITSAGGYRTHTFTGGGTLAVSAPLYGADVVVVGGGGGGGAHHGGGGGGGGVISNLTNIPISAGSYPVVVGGAGAGGVTGVSFATNGGNSSVLGYTAYGGGAGSGANGTPNSGGCGGGEGYPWGENGADGVSTQGWNGNREVIPSEMNINNGGGGGGAGGAGYGIAGGGARNTWAGTFSGGGGGGYAGGPGGGAGAGAGGSLAAAGGHATANTGSGGGGGGWTGGYGGNGGSGIVVIRYPVLMGGFREAVETVSAGGITHAKTKYRYENVGGWGEELTQVVADPDGAMLTTTYAYHLNPANPGNYRKIRSVTQPTGGWSAQEYYDTWASRGLIKTSYAPYLDAPASVPTALDPNSSSGRIVAYTYTAGWNGRDERPLARTEKTSGLNSGKSSWTHGDSLPPADWPREYSTTRSFSDNTDTRYRDDFVQRYRADAWPTVAGHWESRRNADLSQDVWSRISGTYNPGTGTFTPGASVQWAREAIIHGSSSSAGADSISSWNGHTFPAVHLVPNRSTMDTVIFESTSLTARTETWVYVGGGNFTLLNWEKLTWNTDAGRLLKREGSNGATVDYHYANGLVDYTVDANGIRTEYTYDKLWRVETVTKKGTGTLAAVITSGYSYPAQGDITTTYTYDGASRVRQTVVTGGSLSVTSKAEYDLAGRITDQIENHGSSIVLNTGFGYSSGGKIVTTTFPGEIPRATKTTEIYPDGQLKNVTGDGVVHELYNYWIDNPSGRRVVQVVRGDNHAAWTNLYSDWLGRKTEEWTPRWGGVNGANLWYYNNQGQLSKTHSSYFVPKFYQYDTMGRLYREVVDADDNDQINLGSDRVTETAFLINPYDSGTTWWAETRSYVYASGSTPKLTGVTYDRLNLPTNSLAERRVDDIYGNRTSSTATVDRTNKKVTTTTVAPDSIISAIQVAHNGLAVEARNTTDVTVRIEYDALGRTSKSIDPRTGGMVTAYLAGTSLVDKVTRLAGAGSGDDVDEATYTYDSVGRVNRVKDALGKFSYTTYTKRNEVEHVWGENTYPVTYTYNGNGQKLTMVTYAQATSVPGSSWSEPDNPNTTTWNYHAATNLLQSKTDADNKSVTYTYTNANQIDTRVWARTPSVTTAYVYNKLGELTNVNYSDATTDLVYTYNRLGNQATVTDATGQRTFTYNLTGTLELQNEILSSSGGASPFYGDRRISRGYDTATGVAGRYNALRVGSAANPALEYNLGYGYDAYGRFNSAMGAYTYAYVPNSHLIQSMTAGSFVDSRTYDPYRDWVDQRQAAVGAVVKASFGYTQDNSGRVLDVARNGEIFSRYGNSTEGLKTYYGYDERSQLTSEVTKIGASGTVLTGRDDSYQFDHLGSRKTATHNGAASSYTRNSLNQYTSRTVPGIFDVAGATMAGATPTVNGSAAGVSRRGEYFFKGLALDNSPLGGVERAFYGDVTVSDGTTTTLGKAFLAPATEAMAYDLDGNLTDDGRWKYDYDAENRLVRITTSDKVLTAGHPQVRYYFTYDYLGRRVAKTTYSGDGSYWNFSRERRFLYDGWNLLFEFDATATTIGNKLYSYVWGLDLSGTLQGAGGVGGLLAQYDYSTSAYYTPAYDANGNVHALVNGTDGSVVAAYEYDAFGKTLRESGPRAAANPFRFSTKYTDAETGLVYYGLRYYSPTLGRFINKDPIEEKGGLNLYAFCGNNGINLWDYLGQAVTDPMDWVALAFSTGDDLPPSLSASDQYGTPIAVDASRIWQGFSGPSVVNLNNAPGLKSNGSIDRPPGLQGQDARSESTRGVNLKPIEYLGTVEAVPVDKNTVSTFKTTGNLPVDNQPGSTRTYMYTTAAVGSAKYKHTGTILASPGGVPYANRAGPTSLLRWGNLKPETGIMDNNFIDKPGEVQDLYYLGRIQMNFDNSMSVADHFSDLVFYEEIKYGPAGNNSNTYTGTFIDWLHVAKPNVPSAPGLENALPLPIKPHNSNARGGNAK